MRIWRISSAPRAKTPAPPSASAGMEQQRGRIRPVFDCIIFLQGAARRSSPAGICLDLAEQSIIELCVSDEILAEVKDVLCRPRIRAKFPALTDQVAVEFISAVKSFSTVIADVRPEFALARDPKDEPYLNLACASAATYLVTRDADLLDLASASDEVAIAVRQSARACGLLSRSRSLLQFGTGLDMQVRRLQAHR